MNRQEDQNKLDSIELTSLSCGLTLVITEAAFKLVL